MASILGGLVAGAVGKVVKDVADKATGGKVTGAVNKVTVSTGKGTSSSSKGSGSSSGSTSSSSAASGGSGGKSYPNGYTTKYTGGNAALDSTLSDLGSRYNDARERALAGDESAFREMRDLNDRANQARNEAGYAAEYAYDDIESIKKQTGHNSGGGSVGGSSGGTASPGASSRPDAGMQALLDAWKSNAQKQQDNRIDYAVDKAVAELERALADAQGQYKEQQEQVALDERQGMDNTALYAELRGDKGGIGKEQYSSVQNTAAQNRLAVSQAQTKLSTDTARQIEDLRAQGEFQKADAALEIAQNYLTQLISLEQWAAEYNLSAAQFQESVRQWEAEFQAAMDQFNANLELNRAELTGVLPDGTPTLSAKNQLTKQLASLGQSLLSAGVMPTEEQMSAMGVTEAQAQEYLNLLALEKQAEAEAAARKSGSGGGDKKAGKDSGVSIYQRLYDAGIRSVGEAYAWLLDKDYTSTEADSLSGWYKQWMKDYEEAQAESGVNSARFDASAKTLTTLLEQGKADTVRSGLDEVWSKLSDVQRKTLQELLGRYGYYYEPGPKTEG